MRVRPALAAAAAVVLLPLAACSAGEDRSITVLAASSLTETFTALAREFEDRHPGVTVRLAFDSSATLAEQAAGGAPADVLATADTETMASAEESGVIEGEPAVFATNTAVVVTPPGPATGATVTTFSDLAGSQVTYVRCVDTAPCGKVAQALLEAAGIERPPASLEPDVKAVLARVTADEADAGIVFATDARAAGDQVRTVPIPGAEDQPTTYSLGALTQSDHPDLAQEFVTLVTGEVGQRLLAEAGFGDG